MGRPSVLFIMTDQQRFDTIASLGNPMVHTPNLDRLVERGVSFSNAYSTCPVCMPARYTIRTGCEPPSTGVFSNDHDQTVFLENGAVKNQTGPYLAEVMGSLGYRTFGIGKFHTTPWDEDLGYDVQMHTEEIYGDANQRERDAYAAWIHSKHPEYDFVEGLMGERSEMYYMPQMSPVPADCGVEHWVAEQAVGQIHLKDDRPFFGMVSFIGPHPPFAPPIPFNRMYDPEDMPVANQGSDVLLDHMDEQIPWMNHAVWANDIGVDRERVLKARYYGEITYVDQCIGRILDAVDGLDDPDNVLIAFFSDHGDCLGDHHAWQKENFFEASCRVPFLLSWPAGLPHRGNCEHLVCLTDVFGVAVGVAANSGIDGIRRASLPHASVYREGVDLLGVLAGTSSHREFLYGYYGTPGTPEFKIMVRHRQWKYVFMANGGCQQLFDLAEDPEESRNLVDKEPDTTVFLREKAREACAVPGCRAALDGDDLLTLPYRTRELRRIQQFDASRDVTGYTFRTGVR
jgi:arylsulfatase